jgi:CspA family cold shock protein
MDGYKTLKAGQDVDFELVEGPKGLHATHIRAAQSAVMAPATATPRKSCR